MAANSKIEWTTHTFNPWRGCTKVAAGCAHCYAERDSKRNSKLLGIWGDQGTRVLASDEMWREPVKWDKSAACYETFDCNAGDHCDACPQKNRPRVFCASFADVFEEYDLPLLDHRGRQVFVNKDGVMSSEPVGRQASMNDARRRLFKLIDATPNLDWLLLTKRPENIRRMWCSHVNTDGMPPSNLHRKNVWLGTSIATQLDADKNIPELLKCRNLSPVLFVSAEPLLESVDVRRWTSVGLQCSGCDWSGCESTSNGQRVSTDESSDFEFLCPACDEPCGHTPIDECIDWLICGGESGPKAEPMHPAWPRSLRDQCTAAGVPFFFKQWGEWVGGHFDDRKSKMICDAATAGETVGRVFWTNHGEPSVHKWDMLDHYWRHASARVGKKNAGRLLDGREWNEFPTVEVSK